MQLENIDHVALAVRDVERAARWYCDVFGFERQHEGMWNGIPTFVGKGSFGLALFPFRATESASSKNTAILHFAFRASRANFMAAQAKLKRHGISFDFEDHEISHSIYFHDPEGHKIEITTYELA
jgi:catechol 2,3-dioxygenase-like lactoylglutathione lyase family enzyme